MQPTTRTTWTTVREGRWNESWGTCLLHLQSDDDHLWLEEGADSNYRITYGGTGSTGVLAASSDPAPLRVLLSSDAAIELLWETAHPSIPVVLGPAGAAER